MIKNAFLFHGLKGKVNLKIYDVVGRQQIITIHILLNISSSKGNHTMKVGQSMECNIRKIYLENHTQNVVKKLVPQYFVKNEHGGCLWINSPECYKILFLLYVQVEVYQNILKLRSRPLIFTFCKTFQKTKIGLELVSLPHFLYDF